MAVSASEISSIIGNQIRNFEQPIEAVDVGTVVEIGDGIARVYGLSGVKSSELVIFPGKAPDGSDVAGIALEP